MQCITRCILFLWWCNFGLYTVTCWRLRYKVSFDFVLAALSMSFDSSRSGGKQLKRGSNSNQSRSGDGISSGSGKRSKSNQKTLGVAWVANSRSSASRSSFRDAPFSDFGSYMHVKNRKLQDQFAAEACNTNKSSETESGKRIFQGVSIFVDGFTIPSSQELRAYMLKHGGCFENYFSTNRVTHIICSNLPDSKIKNLRSFSRGLPVVKPTWILDSVAADKLLSWSPYQIDQLSSASRNQPKLSAFFMLKNNPANGNEDSGNEVSYSDIPEIEESTSTPGLPNMQRASETKESKKVAMKCEEGVEMVPENFISDPEADTMFCSGKPVESDSGAFNITNKNVSDTLDSTTDSKNYEGLPSRLIETSKHGHSTLEDPNFVENYFKNSRLHFIGTWRTRYRKRFTSRDETKAKSSSPTHLTSSGKYAIIHVDMDSFFVSVVIRKRPELLNKPVAICHSDNPRGTAEISSANYPARDFGIRAGIFVRDAKALCPHLVILPYNFEAYQEVADQFYTILHKHCDNVQAVSCDEAFLEVPYSADNDPEIMASLIRKEIWEMTGCTASVGIGSNMLIARLATRTAKPDGQCNIRPEMVDKYLLELPIKLLPGIGRALEVKLKIRHILTCGQLRMISKETLQRDFGTKTGEMLWNYSRGVDDRLVGNFQESKSVGAEVNWGVRFKELKNACHFLGDLCKEVALRLHGCGMRGRTFTLKIKKRKKDAMEPAKYLGCGDCENLSHSTTVPVATDDVEVMQRIVKQLFRHFSIDVKEIRGVGFHASKLENRDMISRANEKSILHSWLSSASTSFAKKNDDMDNKTTDCISPHEDHSEDNLSNEAVCRNQAHQLPPLSLVDMEVIENLPQEVLSEMDKMYNGKLIYFIAKRKGVEGHSAALSPAMCFRNDLPADEAISNLVVTGSRSKNIVTPNCPVTEVLPTSLSQVDPLVLQELPEDVTVDILKSLPAHRDSCSAAHAALISTSDYQASLHLPSKDHSHKIGDMLPSENLWIGDPPKWVEKFKNIKCLILKKTVEDYGTGLGGKLSFVLPELISRCKVFEIHSSKGSDELISHLSELLRHYIDQKIEQDLEEVHICFCLLKRSACISDVFQQVYKSVFPYLQECITEKYGGKLQI